MQKQAKPLCLALSSVWAQTIGKSFDFI